MSGNFNTGPASIPPLTPGSGIFSSLEVDKLKIQEIIGSITTWKSPVRVCSVSNLVLSGLQTVDTVALVSGDRVLVKAQTNGVENGIYVASTTIWSRSGDMEAGSNASGAAAFVVEGGTCMDKILVCTNPETSATVGVNVLTFVVNTATAVPGGSNTQIQYNAAGVFGGDPLLTWVNPLLSAPNLTATGTVTANSLTDGSATLTGGNLTGLTNLTMIGTLQASTITDGVATLTGGNLTGITTLSLTTLNATTVTATGTVQGSTLTDGVATLTGGSLTGITSLTVTGTIQGGTLTDGTVSITGGVITGVTSFNVGSITATGTIQATTFTDTVATLTAGSWTGLVNVTATGTIQGTTFTDTVATLTSGSWTGLVNVTATGTIQGTTLTDGVASLTGGSLTGITSLTVTGTVQAGTFTDGTLTITAGSITGAINITATGAITGNSLTATGLTSTTIPYVGTGGLLSSNTLLSWTNSMNRMGVGVAAASTTLHVKSGAGTTPGLAATNVAVFKTMLLLPPIVILQS